MDKKEYFDKEYMPSMNRIGVITGFLGVLASFAPALVLAVVYGILPRPAALVTAFISAASTFGILWFVEPVSYFAVLGPVGTYMAFLSGNISNMRVPCASMAQVSAGVQCSRSAGGPELLPHQAGVWNQGLWPDLPGPRRCAGPL